MAYQKSMKKWSFLCSRFPLRRIFRPAGLIRQNSTKGCRTFCKSDVEKLKKLTLHSLYLTYWCPPPGIPLSAVQMEVSKVSMIKGSVCLNSLVSTALAIELSWLRFCKLWMKMESSLCNRRKRGGKGREGEGEGETGKDRAGHLRLGLLCRMSCHLNNLC